MTGLERTEPGEREEEEGEDRHIVGGTVSLRDSRDEYVVGAAEAAVTELNRKSNALFKTVLVDIVDSTSQVSQLVLTDTVKPLNKEHLVASFTLMEAEASVHNSKLCICIIILFTVIMRNVYCSEWFKRTV